MKRVVLVALIIGMLFLALGPAMADKIWLATPNHLDSGIISPGPGPSPMGMTRTPVLFKDFASPDPAPESVLIRDIISSPDEPISTGCGRTPTDLRANGPPTINLLLKDI